tara:strand:- start:71 stop:241 length:171 start_codon:yes stop_codon:yes gene_type:complete
MTSSSLSSLNKAPLLKRAKAMQTRLKRQDSFIQTMFILSSSSIFALIISNTNLSIF